MLFDWIAREGWIVFNWWLIAALAGLTALPLVTRLLSALPDRGYTLARPAGVLLVAYVFWLLTSLGLLNNSAGSIVLAWLIVLGIALAVWFNYGEPFELRAWWSDNRGFVIFTEILFAALLVGWSIVRAHQNGLTGTEKPMDLAFMSAIQRSETFPPNDPWLSGYSISYYYFGYVMAAMFSTLSGVWSTVGFNMHIAMLFALTGTASFGVTYNLVRARGLKTIPMQAASYAATPSRPLAMTIGLLGMVFVIFLGNFHTVIVELPYRRHVVSEDYLRFWDAKDRDTYGGRTGPLDLLSREQARENHWWWFGAARTITERDLNGERVNEVIDEFPQFSFLLADSHPHVMALPYVLLAIGMCLNAALSSMAPNRMLIVFYGICVGGLVFLNTWDAPIYIGVLVAGDGVRRLSKRGSLTLKDWADLLLLGVGITTIMLVAYSPFLVGFQSQLGGILPNVLHPTRFQQLFVHFGPFILMLSFLLAIEAWRGARDRQMNWTLGLLTAGGLLLALVIMMLLLLILGRVVTTTWGFAREFVDANGGWERVITDVLARRAVRIVTPVILLAGLALVVARLFPKVKLKDNEDTQGEEHYPPAHGFVLLLVAVGIVLILVPEFVYLRDNFGWRMNTVFKFYYQSWVVFSIASAYAVYTILYDALLARPAVVVRAAFAVTQVIVVAAGLTYPLLGIYHRMFVEEGSAGASGRELTLDGGPTFTYADDIGVLDCLRELADSDSVVIAEATSGSYELAGRVGALTGLSSVIGWQPHEAQWRGAAYGRAVGSRPDDIRQLYTDLRFDVILPIIQRYQIDYILYGQVERNYYGAAGEEKFLENLVVVCESGSSRIFHVNQQLAALP